jgi:signal transduction histidine kinase/iron only hydrogenase large subunit-like protein
VKVGNTPLVSTVKERCRVCYTCVRECPAKAIRIADRQAEVLAERCVGCGNCVRVCSQHAKQVVSSIPEVRALLSNGRRVAACLAPSFPAEFADVDFQVLVGMVRKLGFSLVNEVGVGADLVAAEYHRLLAADEDHRYIATTCPAIVGFVERYHPDLVEYLAPIVSPMIAEARLLRALYGQDLAVVFIGPCLAKKAEADNRSLRGDVDAALTFAELRQLFELYEVDPADVAPSDFDPPQAGAGALFPVSRGMLQAAEIDEDLMTGDVVAADGHGEFIEALREFESQDLDARLLECLCCNGCIMGAGMTVDAPLFRRRARVGRYVRKRMTQPPDEIWQHRLLEVTGRIDLHCQFQSDDQRVAIPSADELSRIMARMGKTRPQDELNCGACGYATCREHAIAIYKGLAENEMCLPFTIDQLRCTCDELTRSNARLESTQEALMQSEKLASMGQLAAGIAHEVNNPLGTMLMLSHVLLEETEQNSEMREDLAMIAAEAERCKKIVSGLLHFARKNKVEAQRHDVRRLLERCARTLDARDNVEVVLDYGGEAVEAELDRDQVMQVVTNLTSNAMAAMPDGGRLTLSCGGDRERVWFSVTDTGVGIPEGVRKKIFEPFFTTKKAGLGTGLGLSVSYGIVKMHQGDISVTSNADAATGPTGSCFRVTLPRNRRLSETRAASATD